MIPSTITAKEIILWTLIQINIRDVQAEEF